MMERRGLLKGLLAAPFICRSPGLLMPVRKVDFTLRGEGISILTIAQITKEAIRLFANNNERMAAMNPQYTAEFKYIPSSVGTTLKIRLPKDFKNLHHTTPANVGYGEE